MLYLAQFRLPGHCRTLPRTLGSQVVLGQRCFNRRFKYGCKPLAAELGTGTSSGAVYVRPTPSGSPFASDDQEPDRVSTNEETSVTGSYQARGAVNGAQQLNPSFPPKKLLRGLSFKLNAIGFPQATFEEDEEEEQPFTTSAPKRNKIVSNIVFIGLTMLATVTGYLVHPHLLELTTIVWDLKPDDGSDTFESSFLGMISIIYGLLVGNSFLFLYERQINIVQELYNEVFALELLLQHVYLCIPSASMRRQMALRMRTYIAEELYQPVDMVSPFHPKSSFMGVVGLLASIKRRGSDTDGLVKALERLADAQSRRSAVAAQILPITHWLFLHSLELIFVVTLMGFEAVNTTATLAEPSHERQLAFAALCGMLMLTSQVLHDMSDPVTGLYTFRDALDERLTYAEEMVHNMIMEGRKGAEPAKEPQLPSHITDIQKLGLIEAMAAHKEPNNVKRRRGRLVRPSDPLPTAWSPQPDNLYYTVHEFPATGENSKDFVPQRDNAYDWEAY